MNTAENTSVNTQLTTTPNVIFDFTTLDPHQKDFMMWLYAQVYNSETGLWLNGSLEPTLEFSRSWIRSMCRTFGYSGTIQWIVRKRFGRRTQRGTYQIPELLQIHSMLQSGQLTETTVTTRKSNTVTITCPKKG
jgi:hypothetical protein